MATVGRLNVELAMDSSGFESGIAKAQQQTESMTAKLGKAGATMSAAVTLPLAGIATMALKSAGDFESSMNVLQSVSGATAGDMQAMTEQALRLGAETSFSAGEAADAMLELGKAGLGTKDIMGAMPGVLSLAAAGGLGVGEAAGIAANALNTFGLDATEAANVSNMLAAAANASSADVTDLAMGFKMAGSIFASNNQSMSDLTASMSLLSNAGIAGSDAGTSLKTMLMRLAAPTDQAAAVMASLGLNVYNADGSMRSFEHIVGNLSAVTKDLTDSERNMALSTIFGADAIRAATILTDAGAAGFADMEAAVTKAGAAEKAAGARMKGLNGAMDYLQGSIDSVLITVGTPFLQFLGDAARYVADMITSFTALPAPVRNAALAFAGILAAAGPIMLAVSGIATAIGFILSPIGLLVVAVAALAAAWVSNFGGIQQKTMAVFNALQPVFRELQKWFDLAMKGDFSGLQGEIGNAINSVKVAVANFEWADFITPLLDWGVYVATLTWNTIVTTFSSWADYISSLDWGTFITALSDWGTYITAKLSDWGAYISSLDWGGFVTTWADWASKIAKLQWDVFVTAISWAVYIDQLIWDNYLSKIDWVGIITSLTDWGTYITKLAWSDYIVPLWSDYIVPVVWDDYITKLDWGTVGLTTLDWATWIPAIAWEMFISPVRWGTWLVSLAWNEVINPVNWNTLIPKLVSWAEYIDGINWNLVLNPIVWGAFIGSLLWDNYIVKFTWGKIVEKVDWLEHIPVLTWPTFSPPKWSEFIASLAWPTIELPKWEDFIPDLSWPTISAPKWSDFIPDISWPTIPAFPGWVDILAALGFGQSIPSTPSTGGQNPATQPGSGLSNNGYGQPGSNVDINPPYPSSAVGAGSVDTQSRLGGVWNDMAAAMSGSGAQVTVYATVASDIDIHAMAYQVATEINRWRR